MRMFFAKGVRMPRSRRPGLCPKCLRINWLDPLSPFPDPLYNTSMSQLTREFLLEKGIRVPEDWRSKELSPEMVDQADLIITAIAAQKEELCDLYEEACHKIFSIREMSEKKGYLFSEDFSALPLDQNYWYYAEEDPKYVSKTLRNERRLS